jgi:hypothetical protein
MTSGATRSPHMVKCGNAFKAPREVCGVVILPDAAADPQYQSRVQLAPTRVLLSADIMPVESVETVDNVGAGR